MEESTPPPLKGGSGGDGFCVSPDPGARNQSASRPSLGRRREEHKENGACEEQDLEGKRLAFFLCLHAPEEPPRHAWLTPPGSDADRETATFPSCLLLPSMGYDMRVETG